MFHSSSTMKLDYCKGSCASAIPSYNSIWLTLLLMLILFWGVSTLLH